VSKEGQVVKAGSGQSAFTDFNATEVSIRAGYGGMYSGAMATSIKNVNTVNCSRSASPCALYVILQMHLTIPVAAPRFVGPHRARCALLGADATSRIFAHATRSIDNLHRIFRCRQRGAR
jgi:hypothetical protein